MHAHCIVNHRAVHSLGGIIYLGYWPQVKSFLGHNLSPLLINHQSLCQRRWPTPEINHERSYLGGTATHLRVKKRFVLPDIVYIYYIVQQFYYIYPASGYSTFCHTNRWQPVVHGGFSAAGQLVRLVYRGKINDITLCESLILNII